MGRGDGQWASGQWWTDVVEVGGVGWEMGDGREVVRAGNLKERTRIGQAVLESHGG